MLPNLRLIALRVQCFVGGLAVAVLTSLALPAGSDASLVWVGNHNSSTVTTLDTETNSLVGDPIPVGLGSSGMAVTADGSKVLHAAFQASDLDVIDPTTRTRVAEIPLSGAPGRVAAHPDGRTAYVSHGNGISVVDLEAEAETDLLTGFGTGCVAVSPDGALLYVCDSVNDAISVIDTTTLVAARAPIPTGADPRRMALEPDGSHAYVLINGTNAIEKIDLATGLATSTYSFSATTDVSDMFPGPGADVLYVTDPTNDELFAVETSPFMARGPFAAVAAMTGGAAVPDGSRVVTIHNKGSGIVEVWDTTSFARSGEIASEGFSPFGTTATPDQGPSATFAVDALPAGSASGFDGSGSSDPDGTVVRYDWDFGDGRVAGDAGPKPVHIYREPGTYTVTLTVVDDAGCSDRFVFTGQTASCNGSSAAVHSETVVIAPPPEPGDVTPPTVVFESGPDGPVAEPDPTFVFSADEDPVTYECSLEGSPFTPCTTPHSPGPHEDGRLQLRVRAIDDAGNTGGPASRSFRVDTTVDGEPDVPNRVKLRKGKLRIKVPVEAGEGLGAIAKGAVRISSKKLVAAAAAKKVKLRAVRTEIPEGTTATLTLRPKKRKDERRLAKALRGGRKAEAQLKLTLSDELGNRVKQRPEVQIR